jgi:hypothetical protein
MKVTVFVPTTVDIPDEALPRIHAGVLLELRLKRREAAGRVFTHELLQFAEQRAMIDPVPEGSTIDSDVDYPWSAAELVDAAAAQARGGSLARFVELLERDLLRESDRDREGSFGDLGGEG